MAKRQGKGDEDLIKEELREEQGEDSKFGNFVKMAIERGTPLTERDYNKYYPNNV